MHELRIEGLTKRFAGRDGTLAIDNVSLEVEAGELLVLLGPSGCGKTTLLRSIAGLEDPDAGVIRLDGKAVFDSSEKFNLPTHRRDVGMVFQNYSLWPHMTVHQNVEYPLRSRRMDRKEWESRVQEVLKIVRCESLGQRIPAALSGGQQQRIALARALAPRPALLLLDEPLSNLDALLRLELRAQLRAIHRELGFTAVHVTHDQAEAFSLGTRVAVMRAGRIEQLGLPHDIYCHPATTYVADFLGVSNRISLRRQGNGWITPQGHPIEAFPEAAPTDSEMMLYLRPEHLRLSRAAQATPPGTAVLGQAVVLDVLYGGSEIDYVIDMGGQELVARFHGSSPELALGDPVQPFFLRDDALLYSAGALVPKKASIDTTNRISAPQWNLHAA